MQKRAQAQRKVTSLLLIFAMLFVSIAVFVPVTTFSAGNDTPTKLMCLHPTSSQSYYSNSIKLRFAFSINSTYSGTAGIVYSFTNENPTIGGSGCTNKTATIYPAGQTISWHGTPMSAGSGRKWAVSETNTIQNAQYTDPIYVRAYIMNGSTPDYSALLTTSVWAMFLREWNESSQIFDNSYFGGTNNIATDLDALTTTHYNDPLTTPTVGQHPRVLFTESALPGIRDALDNAPDSPWPDKGDGAKQRYNAVIANPPVGIISSDQYDGKMLNDIQLTALIYQMTGNQTYGYVAIFALKNILKNMGTWDYGDVCRYYGHVMYVAACVYDWCYDLLTTKDKQQIVAGVQHKCCEGGRMEVGFPPKNQGALTGHGSENQILRDYLAFAIAIYDEYPGWWDYIAGRFYQEFVPVRNEYYKAGMVPQGTSLYVRVRFVSDLYSALLVKAATGTFPYASQSNMQQVMRTVYAHELPRLYSGDSLHAFASGDDHTDDSDFQDFGRCSLLASYLFNDKTARAMLQRFKWSYSVFDDHLTKRASVAEYLICSSSGVQPASSSHSGVSKILYNGGWLGQIITRDAWDDTQAATLMKIGCRTTANHDHADAGQFQIWYKGMLAGDTGSYDTYNDNHFKKYHQATVAHNCIVLGNDEGQKQPGETGNFNNGSSSWLQSNTYKTGTVTGMRYGYSDSNQNTPAYAYIAGDLTPAYSNTGKVSSYNRRMLTVYDTADSNEEIYFFVYDNITTNSASTQKKFLLHVPTNPTISGNKVTVVNEQGGKLVLQNVFGGSTISKVGGIVFSPYGNFVPSVSSNYKVNGVQIYTDETHYDGYWGRVEIKTDTSSANSELLNVMYVCDETDATNLTAQSISSSKVKGAVLGNTAAVFVSSSTPLSSSHSFSVPGSGTKKFYISGVADGNWTIKRNGTTVGTYQASGGLLVFTAQTGTIELVK